MKTIVVIDEFEKEQLFELIKKNNQIRYFNPISFSQISTEERSFEFFSILLDSITEHMSEYYVEQWKKGNYEYSIDKAPISLFIHSQDSTVKDVVQDFFLRAKQGELITNHDSYSPHGQFAFTFFDVYIEAFKDIMKDEKHLVKFIEAFNMLKGNYENQELMKILEQRSPQLEIMDILHIPNEFWINLIWKST